MTQLQNAFVPANYNPVQGSAQLPLGRHPFRITESAIVPNKDEQGGHLKFGVTIIEGPNQGATGDYRINLYHQNAKTCEIAHNQLAALAYACNLGHTQISDTRQFEGQCFIGEVTNQKLTDQQAARQAAGEQVVPFTQISKVFYMDGREPGKEHLAPTQAPSQAQPLPPAPAPVSAYQPPVQQQAPAQGWQQPAAPEQHPAAQPAAQGWQQPAAPAQQAAPTFQQPAAPAAGPAPVNAGWQQNAAPGAAKPAWGAK